MRVPKTPPPFSERQVEPGIVRAEADTHVPAESFGGVSPQLQEQENRTANLEEKVVENTENFITTARKNQILDEVKLHIGTAKSAKGLNSIQYSPTKEDSLTGKFKQKILQENQNASVPGHVKKAVSEFTDHLFAGMDGELQLDIAKKTTLVGINTQKDFIKKLNSMAGSVYNDPKLRDSLQKQLEDATDHFAELKGSPDTTGAQKAAQKSNFQYMIASAYRANQDPQGGQKYIDELKKSGQLSDSKQFERLQGIINQAADTKTAVDYYRNAALVKKDANGYPDVNAIIAEGRKQGLTPAQEKTILVQYSQDKRLVDAEHSGKMTSFKNVLSNKPDTSTILKTADNLSWNGASRDAMLKLAANPKHGDLILNFSGKGNQLQAIHHNIYQNIMEGNIDQDKLFRIYNAGGLDNDSYQTAQKLLDSNNKSGLNAGKAAFSRSAWREIQDAYAGDSDRAVQFRTDFMKHMSDNPDASVQDLRKYLDENLKPAMKNPAKFWDMLHEENMSGTPGQAEQSLKATVGAATLTGITSYLSKNNPNYTPDDFHEYLKGLGMSLDDVAVGTPANNAINSILDWNKANPTRTLPLDKNTIMGIVQKYPNGYAY